MHSCHSLLLLLTAFLVTAFQVSPTPTPLACCRSPTPHKQRFTWLHFLWQCYPAAIHMATFSMTMLSCMDLGSNDALTHGDWADLIVSGAKEDILTPHSPFPLLIYSFSQPLLCIWLIGKPVQFLKTGFHRNLKQSNSLLCWEAFQTPSLPLSSNPFILYFQYSPILSPVDLYSGISAYQSDLLNRLNWLNRQNLFFFSNLFYAILMKLTHKEAEDIQDKKSKQSGTWLSKEWKLVTDFLKYLFQQQWDFDCVCFVKPSTHRKWTGRIKWIDFCPYS